MISCQLEPAVYFILSRSFWSLSTRVRCMFSCCDLSTSLHINTHIHKCAHTHFQFSKKKKKFPICELQEMERLHLCFQLPKCYNHDTVFLFHILVWSTQMPTEKLELPSHLTIPLWWLWTSKWQWLSMVMLHLRVITYRLYIFKCKLLPISIYYILKLGDEFSAWRSEQHLLPLMKMPQLQAGVAGMKILQLKLNRVS